MDISSLSLRDYIFLTAQYSAMLRGEKDNEPDLITRGYNSEQLKKIKKSKRTAEININGIKFTRPLTSFVYPLIQYVLVLFDNYEKGNLPFPGPISEQPAQIIEIFNVLQGVRLAFQKSQNAK